MKITFRLLLGIALLVTASLIARSEKASAAGPYQLSTVASVTFDLPPNILLPTTNNFNCIVRTDYPGSGEIVPMRAVCYNVAAPAVPPPPPEPYAPVAHITANGVVSADGSLFVALVPCAFVETPATEVRIWIDTQLSKTSGPISGTVTVRQNNASTGEDIDCTEGTETTGPATITMLPSNQNSDALLIPNQNPPGQLYDVCPDYAELGPSAGQGGGLRDPFNPYDYYDVNGDGVIDLPNDTLGVISHFAPGGYPPEDIKYDCGPGTGPGGWNTGPPDDVIDLPNDILGVINSFNPSGCPVP